MKLVAIPFGLESATLFRRGEEVGKQGMGFLNSFVLMHLSVIIFFNEYTSQNL